MPNKQSVYHVVLGAVGICVLCLGLSVSVNTTDDKKDAPEGLRDGPPRPVGCVDVEALKDEVVARKR